VVVCYDADRTYPIEDVARLAARVESGECDVASASPFLPGAGVEGVSGSRVTLTRGAALAYRLVLGRRAGGVRTFTCAFRAYRGDLARTIEFDSDGFPAAGEILSRLLLAGARVVEVPSVLSVRSEGVSRLRVGRTVRGHLGVLARLLRWHPPRRARTPSRAEERPAPSRAEIVAMNRELPMRLLEGHANPAIRRIEARRRGSLLRLLDLASGTIALDVGAEEGHLSDAIEAGSAGVVRVDLDPSLLRRGKGRAVAADAERLPFRKGAFDRVLLAAVLEHVPDPRRAAAEAVRVLAPGGRAVISVPDDRTVVRLKRLLRSAGLGAILGPLSRDLAPGHLRIYTPARLRGHLAGRVRAIVRDPLALSVHAVVVPGGAR
jgi:SAM-dependent methyltransferase